MNAPYPTRSFDAVTQPLHVLIVGGGIGGLALAQGLKREGVSAAIYERDTSLTSRLQGYRVHISPGGSRALLDLAGYRPAETFIQVTEG